MGTIAVRRAALGLLVTLLAVVTCYTVLASDAKAAVRPAPPRANPAVSHPGKSHLGKAHRPVIGDAVKYVRNADGSVTRTR